MSLPKGTRWWLLWFAAFLCYEFWALGGDVTYTLSWNVWHLMDESWFFRILIPLGLAWLLKHFTWDWYKRRPK